MRKYTLRELRDYIRTGAAINLTNATLDSVRQLPPLNKIGYSSGVYGINGGLLQDPKTGQLYAVTARFNPLTPCGVRHLILDTSPKIT